jgi:hypothetical protein
VGGLLGGVKRMICAFVMPNVMTAVTTNMLMRRIFCAPQEASANQTSFGDVKTSHQSF